MPRHLLLFLAFWAWSALVAADGPCRIAFDMGSSGIRAGSTTSRESAHVDIDYLAPLLAARGIADVVGPTIDALRDLPGKAGFPTDCKQVGGGFSAWRLALAQDQGGLVPTLAHIWQATGVSVLVVPQGREGRYGYEAARSQLSDALKTSHVLDIGGGSMQIAGLTGSFGDMLGQKVWHVKLCRALRKTEQLPCQLLPMSADDLDVARRLAAEALDRVEASLPDAISLTAISRPVSRGILPALRQLSAIDPDAQGIDRTSLSTAIVAMAPTTQEGLASRIGSPPKYLAYLFSDMLLVEGILRSTKVDFLHVAEADLTNVPGLLADEQAYMWHDHYPCYLERLRQSGIDAFYSGPANCRDSSY